MKRAPRIDLNPSAADRWTTCTASPKFIHDHWEKIPEDTSTVYSQEGTLAHEVAAAYLLGQKPKLADPDMLWHGWNYAEYVEVLMGPGAKLLVEQKLPLWYMPERNAIVDAAVINRDSIHIIDYKYGEGVAVSPERSLQVTIYAFSVIQQLEYLLPDNYPISIHIYQPRGRNAEDGPAHVWETKYGEIQEIAHWIKAMAAMIQFDVNTVFAPSDKACQFCPAKGFCAARQSHLTQDIEALAVIEKTDLPSPQVMTPEQTAAVLTHKEQIVKWLNDVEAYALDRMKAGNQFPGIKLVMSRGGNRYWRDPQEAKRLLLEQTILKEKEVIEEKIISPGGVEKLLGKNKMGAELLNLIDRPPGKPVVALADDKREPFNVLEEISVVTTNQ